MSKDQAEMVSQLLGAIAREIDWLELRGAVMECPCCRLEAAEARADLAVGLLDVLLGSEDTSDKAMAAGMSELLKGQQRFHRKLEKPAAEEEAHDATG